MTYKCPTCGSQNLSFDGPGYLADIVESDDAACMCEDCGWHGIYENARTVEVFKPVCTCEYEYCAIHGGILYRAYQNRDLGDETDHNNEDFPF